jgi:hypothetical protein
MAKTKLKPFTNYICSGGSIGLGHSSMWTGDGHMVTERDGNCVCGLPLMEEVSDGYTYRVEFESINPLLAAEMEHVHGKHVWPQLSPAQWDALQWIPIANEGKKSAIENQYQNLMQSAEARSQPIRNVRLLKRQEA